MFILLPKKNFNVGYRILAVNLNNYDEIAMTENNDKTKFSLVLMKIHDGRNQIESTSDLILGVFDSESECFSIFEDILESLKTGKATYKMPNVF